MADKRPPVDWERIESEYRAGQLSVREIAKIGGISHTAIQKRAKAGGWVQDLTARVKAAVANKLVANEVATPASKAADREAVEAFATRAADVVFSHRKEISRYRAIASDLAAELESDRKKAIKDRLALAARTDVLERLSRISVRLIQLEREAFNLDAPPLPPSGARTADLNKLEDADLDRLEAILAKAENQPG